MLERLASDSYNPRAPPNADLNAPREVPALSGYGRELRRAVGTTTRYWSLQDSTV